MSTETPWLEYRLEKLEFHNGAVLGFRRARMLYNTEAAAIKIEHLDSSPQHIDDSLREIANPDGTLPEIKTIYYEMRVSGFPPMAFFWHPIGKGAEIRIEPPRAGQTVLIFRQADGRAMFSKDYTLRDVTRGKIDSSRAVWQFHGFKHEH